LSVRVAPAAVWLACTLAISAAFGSLAAHNLANFRPVSNDEVELIAVGYKLASQGILGSDMYVGFFGGDQHHFETLPLQHVLDALSFRVFGAGILQARLVSLLAGISVVWSAGWLAFRWYGPLTALICELLLVAWPSNLTAAANGLPLLGVSRAARYDVLGLAAVWLAIVLVDVTLRRPRAMCAFAAGLCCGLATLAQFFGSFVVLFALTVWWWSRPRVALLCAWLAGVALVIAPYAMFAARNAADVAGQLTVFGTRGDFLRPSFYLDNVLSEWTRYAHLGPTSPGTWLLALGVLPSVLLLAWRRSAGDRLLLGTLAVFVAALTLLDQTKVPLYSVLLLPSVCLVLAAGISTLLNWAGRRARPVWPRLLAGALGAAAMLGMASDSLDAYRVDWLEASQVTPYLVLGEQIRLAVPPGSPVLGPERWWWPLREHRYLALRSLWFQWSAAAAAHGDPKFIDWVSDAQPDRVIVNVNVRADVRAFPAALQAQFWRFIEDCTTLVTDLDDPTYFSTQVYAVPRPLPASCT
jgi:4-amino-4-deoxy-L-arabinose transferase-like glycosyltransferase